MIVSSCWIKNHYTKNTNNGWRWFTHFLYTESFLAVKSMEAYVSSWGFLISCQAVSFTNETGFSDADLRLPGLKILRWPRDLEKKMAIPRMNVNPFGRFFQWVSPGKAADSLLKMGTPTSWTAQPIDWLPLASTCGTWMVLMCLPFPW